MEVWPWWVSGLALAGVMMAHWLLVGRMLAVSGLYSSIVNRIRHGKTPGEDEEMTHAELAEAMRLATEAAFGVPEPGEAPEIAVPEEDDRPVMKSRSFHSHFLFFAAVLVGGLLSALLSGDFAVSFGLHGEKVVSILGSDPLLLSVAMVFGGVLVGFGTRMAGGCTSGHGLAGVSRLQVGSLVSTAAFFGAGIAVSFLLGAL